MPQPAQNPITFETKGSLISDDMVPVIPDRRFIFNIGQNMMQRFYKPADTPFSYLLDLAKIINPTEKITGVYGLTDNDALTISRLEFTESKIVCWLYGGANKARQICKLRVILSTGALLDYQFALITHGTYPALAEVRLSGPGIVFVGLRKEDTPAPEKQYRIAMSPPHHVFPFTPVGKESPPVTFRMTNTGTEKVYLRKIQLKGDFAFKSKTEETLGVGESIDFTIRFTPTTGGGQPGGIHEGIFSVEIQNRDLEPHVTLLGTS